MVVANEDGAVAAGADVVGNEPNIELEVFVGWNGVG